MLNEDKIKLMTELALFEKKHASQMKTVNQYFKSDYISRNLLRGFISYIWAFEWSRMAGCFSNGNGDSLL